MSLSGQTYPYGTSFPTFDQTPGFGQATTNSYPAKLPVKDQPIIHNGVQALTNLGHFRLGCRTTDYPTPERKFDQTTINTINEPAEEGDFVWKINSKIDCDNDFFVGGRTKLAVNALLKDEAEDSIERTREYFRHSDRTTPIIDFIKKIQVVLADVAKLAKKIRDARRRVSPSLKSEIHTAIKYGNCGVEEFFINLCVDLGIVQEYIEYTKSDDAFEKKVNSERIKTLIKKKLHSIFYFSKLQQNDELFSLSNVVKNHNDKIDEILNELIVNDGPSDSEFNTLCNKIDLFDFGMYGCFCLESTRRRFAFQGVVKTNEQVDELYYGYRTSMLLNTVSGDADAYWPSNGDKICEFWYKTSEKGIQWVQLLIDDCEYDWVHLYELAKHTIEVKYGDYIAADAAGGKKLHKNRHFSGNMKAQGFELKPKHDRHQEIRNPLAFKRSQKKRKIFVIK